MTRRLIEDWLPIAALGVEGVRERTPMTPFPAPNRLHVWWARRPLVASRAAVLASLLPADADRADFLHAVGIHGDPVATRLKLDIAKRTGENFGLNPYGYPRAFQFNPAKAAKKLLGSSLSNIVVLDPTAGGGAIPFEAARIGATAIANDLNPVAATILYATVDYPARFGDAIADEFEALSNRFKQAAEAKFANIYPDEPEDGIVDGYLWARTVACPYCAGTVPLSPNWKLAPDGTGVQLRPRDVEPPMRKCDFEIVDTASAQSPGTVSDGDGLCPWPDCARPIDGDHIKAEAQAGRMGDQLFAVVYKRRVQVGRTAKGAPKFKLIRGYRAPQASDDNSSEIEAALAERLPEWDAFDVIPNEAIPDGNKTSEPQRYGLQTWRDLFSPRQLLAHGLASETYRALLEADRAEGRLTDVRQAAYVYLSFGLSKLLNWNARLASWNVEAVRMRSVFDRHDFAFKWSYAEMALMIEGLGFDWAIEQTAKCIRELVELSGASSGLLASERSEVRVAVSNLSGANLPHIADASVDAIVIDPPYGANVMYAELSDFFYVWLKRTAGLVLPELFGRRLTDKDAEAVANVARFRGETAPAVRANRDYQDKMAAIFAEARRVLKPDGIMTVMFTHKDAGAWDALTLGLIDAGFVITASWPVNTEAEGSLHIKDKAAASSTIFLVCRPRATRPTDAETIWWEDVEPKVREAVRTRIASFQEAGITGVDLYLASFGPALEAFSQAWPLRRGAPRPELPAKKRARQAALFDEVVDPYEVRPEDALDVARREVKAWRLRQLSTYAARAELDPATAWVLLAWDAFHAPVFPFDEGLRLARAVGADLDAMVGTLCVKKGSDLRLLDSVSRMQTGKIGAADGSSRMIDALHTLAARARMASLESARELAAGLDLQGDPAFLAALQTALEALPPGGDYTGIELKGDLAGHAADFDALEKLRRLLYAAEIEEPRQLKLGLDAD
jgi:adenine-specific DNA methylase